MKSSIELCLEKEFAEEQEHFLIRLIAVKDGLVEWICVVWEFEKEVEAIKKSLGDISFQDQRVLITGGAGFLGPDERCLVSQEAEVICADNLASGLKSNVDHLPSR